MITAYNLSHIVSFTVITCCQCGIAFGVDATVRQSWIDKGTRFYCPAGHDQVYCESTVQKLTKELEDQKRVTAFARNNAAAERAAREQAERQLQAHKGVNTRLRNRIKQGVCPCCNRTFQNLQQHMKTQHASFNKDAGAK